MPIARTFLLRFHNGETGSLNQLDDGSYACPVCGEPWERFPPYWPNDGELGPKHDRSGPNLGEVCPGCETQFGIDDRIAPTSPIGAFRKKFAKLRHAWLEREKWSEPALRQLRQNLGLGEEDLRKEAGALQ